MKKTLLLTAVFSIFLILGLRVNAQPSDWIRLTAYQYGDRESDCSLDGEKIAFKRTQSDQWH